MKKQEPTLETTAAKATSNKIISNLDELFLQTRIALGQKVKVVYATKDLVETVAQDPKAIRVSVQGIEVQAYGYEDQCKAEDMLTIEQVNFGKV